MSKGPAVSLTERAMSKVKEFLAQSGDPSEMLRISLVRTHCMGGRGHAYRLTPEASPRDGDVVEESDGLKLILRQEDLPRLQGTVIDYNEGWEGSGFSVNNPNATGKCPCGHHDLFD